MTKVERILVPVEDETGLAAVIDLACVVARGLDAAITLLHIYEPPNEVVGIVPGATVAGEVAAEQAAATSLLDHATALALAAGMARVDRIHERASPAARAIVDHARAGKFDLVVMGTHARKGLARLVLGSTAERVLRDAPCPVLTIHLPHA